MVSLNQEKDGGVGIRVFEGKLVSEGTEGLKPSFLYFGDTVVLLWNRTSVEGIG